MPVNRFVVRLQGVSNLPKDVYENVLYFDGDWPDSHEGNSDEIIAAYSALPILGGIASAQIRVYELEGGQPVFQKDYPTFNKTAETGPGEVAVCLSYATVDDPELSTGRRRGRIYIGPLAAAQVGSARPGSTLRAAVLDLGEALAQVGFAANTTWMMYSPTDSESAKIESIWCDDAWDTQRRRGLDPTTRDVRDVQ